MNGFEKSVGERRTGLWFLGIGRRGQERGQGRLPGFRAGHLVDGGACSEVGTLRRNHFRGGRVLVGPYWVSEVVRAQGGGYLVGS